MNRRERRAKEFGDKKGKKHSDADFWIDDDFNALPKKKRKEKRREESKRGKKEKNGNYDKFSKKKRWGHNRSD